MLFLIIDDDPDHQDIVSALMRKSFVGLVPVWDIAATRTWQEASEWLVAKCNEKTLTGILTNIPPPRTTEVEAANKIVLTYLADNGIIAWTGKDRMTEEIHRVLDNKHRFVDLRSSLAIDVWQDRFEQALKQLQQAAVE